MNNDLISRSELKKVLKSNCDTLCNDKNTNWCEHCCPLNDFEDLIDNAPTVKTNEMTQDLIDKVNVNVGLAQPIKVNIPEDIKDKLIEEMSKPRKVIFDESKTVKDCIIAYSDGFESARRLFESKCHDCDFRKFTETFINGIVEVMTKNGIESVEQLSEILGKGNDND